MARPEKGFQFVRRHGIMRLPRKGTKTTGRAQMQRKRMYHPRKGAKTTHLPSTSRCHSTIPVRGRKPTFLLFQKQADGTIPVRGRKPQDKYTHVAMSGTIPVRGRKLGVVRVNTLKLCTIPARGQKTPHQKKMRSFSFANLNFLFSVGCPSMNGTIAAAVIFSLLRLLHGDKMCYNKANSKHLLQN